jgi:hypothetical protein
VPQSLRRPLLISVNGDAAAAHYQSTPEERFSERRGSMRAFDLVRGIFAKLAALITPSRHDFVCGECERWERCGQPPDDRCIVMATQIAQRRGRPVRHVGLPQC